jgi:hypothetical protein
VNTIDLCKRHADLREVIHTALHAYRNDACGGAWELCADRNLADFLESRVWPEVDAASAHGAAQERARLSEEHGTAIRELAARVHVKRLAAFEAGARQERARLHEALCRCPIYLVERDGKGDRIGMRRADVSKALHHPEQLPVAAPSPEDTPQTDPRGEEP